MRPRAGELAKEIYARLKVVDDIHRPLKLYCDNEPTVTYAHNNRSSNAAKRIDIKFYVVKDKVRDHAISLEHVSTKKMLADKRLTTQCIQITLSWHEFTGKPMIPGQ
jgi:hypothetical protein